MSFKDEIAADNLEVFMNDLEFAEKHNLNGVICLAVVQKMLTSSELSTGNLVTDDIYNLYGETVQVNFLAEHLAADLAYGDPFVLDGTQYIVKTCNNEMGMITLELIGNQR